MTDEQKSATTFKAGDRVRRVGKPTNWLPLGYETTIFARAKGELFVVDTEGDKINLHPQWWQKVEVAPPPAIVDELKAGGIQAVMDAVDADRYGTIRSLIEWGERMERERDALKALATRTAEVVDIATHYEKRAEVAEAKVVELEALVDAIEDTEAEFGAEALPIIGEIIGRYRHRAALAASDKGGRDVD